MKSGWAFSARVSGNVIAERSGAVDISTSSMGMKMKAVTEALLFLKERTHKKVVTVNDSMTEAGSPVLKVFIEYSDIF